MPSYRRRPFWKDPNMKDLTAVSGTVNSPGIDLTVTVRVEVPSTDGVPFAGPYQVEITLTAGFTVRGVSNVFKDVTADVYYYTFDIRDDTPYSGDCDYSIAAKMIMVS